MGPPLAPLMKISRRMFVLLATVGFIQGLHAEHVAHHEFKIASRRFILTYSESQLKEAHRKFEASGQNPITAEAARMKAKDAIEALVVGEPWFVPSGLLVTDDGIPLYHFACNHLRGGGRSYEFVFVKVLLDGTVLAPKALK